MIFDFSPYIFEINGVGLRYYSLMYLLGFLAIFFWMTKVAKYERSLIEDFCFKGFVSMVMGGRLGYVLFYTPSWIIENPFQILKIWEGGMSFHGGLLGILLFALIFLKKRKIDILHFFDELAFPAIFSTGLGRIGNFFNGEVFGTPTDFPFCFVLPGEESCRHPAQLYQSMTDWALLFILLLIRRKHASRGTITSLYLIGYAFSRIFNEVFFREPSWVWYGITAGTWLSVPMIISGIVLLIYSSKA